jgi:putative phage-type endonuclease
MALTTEQREARRHYIGSSDSPAIMGLDPYRSAADVWLEKTGRAADFAGNDATDRGNYLEPALLAFAEQTLGVPLTRDVMVKHQGGVLAANLDAVNYDGPFIVEAKSSVVPEGWGEQGTDQVPDRVLVQTHHAMYVAGIAFRVAWVPVVLPGFRSFDFRMYCVARNDALAEAVAQAGVAFMERHVRTDTPPDDFRPSLEVLKRVRREPNKTVSIADELALAYTLAKAQYAEAKQHCEQAERSLLAAMGDAEAAECPTGKFTYFQVSRKAYTVEATTYRQLRFSKAK